MTYTLKEKLEGDCEERGDGLHCVHWWDGEACCDCKIGAPVHG